MANAAILAVNLADAASVTADSEALSMPASLLQNVHVRKRWRSTAATAAILCDLGASLSPDTFGLFGLTVGAGATCRLRVSTVDATGAAGDALDTGVLTSSSAWFDPDYGAFVYASAAVTGRYVRFDLADAGADYVEAGRLVAGVRTAFGANFTPGSTRGRVDLSRRTRTQGGQMLLDRKPKARTLALDFDFLTAAEWAATLEAADRDNGLTDDVLLILDPTGDNVARDAIWGLLTDLSPVAFTAIPDIVSKQYRLEERL